MKQLSIYDFDHGPDHLSAALPPQQISSLSPLESETGASRNPDPKSSNITEIILSVDMANSVQMILPMLTHLHQEQRWLAWIDPPSNLLKQWQESKDKFAMKDIMILRSTKTTSAKALAQKALKAGTSHAVVMWTDNLSNEDMQALEDASNEGNSSGIVLRYR